MNKQWVNGKRILVAGWLALLANTFCIPLWTECDYVGFVRTLFNKEARLDLLYSGEITKSEPFHVEAIPKPFNTWWSYMADNLHCSNLSLKAKRKWQRLSLQLKAQRDGKITMLFRGSEVRDEYGFFYSVLTDWRNVKLNGKTILPKRKTFSFKKTFTRQVSVKKGDALHIEAEFRRHHFSIHDFTGLKSGNLWYIITGNLLLFSLICLLMTYIAKRRESVRPSDMLLLVVFFLLLFIPMIGISNAARSVRENRMLAGKPELKDLFKEESDYGRRYESWFNDHFCGRVSLMKVHDALRNKLSCIIRTEKALYFKENGWKIDSRFAPWMNCELPFVQSCIHNLVRLNQFCQQNNIKLYVLEVPKKEIIYKEFIKKYYGFDEKSLIEVLGAQDTVRNEARRHRIPYVYPYKALRDAAQKDFVMFKWNEHWTDWGAYVGYRELMKEISKDFPDIPIASLNEFRKSRSWLIREIWDDAFVPTAAGRQLRQFFNYWDADDPPNRTFYNYYDHKNGAEMVLKIGKFTKDFTYPKGQNKMMLIGTSQNDNLVHFLPYSAAQMKYIRANLAPVKWNDWYKILKLYRKNISAFKPDILILSLGPDDMPRLSDLCASK